MSISNKILDIGPQDWTIIPGHSTKITQLYLALCTGVVIRPRPNYAPYLIVHSGPAHYENESSMLIFSVMNKKNFKSHTNKGGISLNQILDNYGEHLIQERYNLDLELYVYIFSGLRTLKTDIGMFLHFSNSDHYSLMGAELNQAARVSINHTLGQIKTSKLLDDVEIANFNIGQHYEINLRY